MKPIYLIQIPLDREPEFADEVLKGLSRTLKDDYHVHIIFEDVPSVQRTVLGESFTKELYQAKHTLDNLIGYTLKRHYETVCAAMPITWNEELEKQYFLRMENFDSIIFNIIDDYYNIKFKKDENDTL